MLISKIKVGNRLIKMIGRAPNIFDICSLSLLIGPNGSGKSMMLKLIAEFFSGRFNDLIVSKMYVQLVGGNSLAGSVAAENWGVVYYSAVPYAPTFTKSSNLIDASSRRSDSIDMFEIAMQAETLNFFGFKPTLEFNVKWDVAETIKNIIEIIYDYDFPSKQSLFPGSHIFDQLSSMTYSKKILIVDLWEQQKKAGEMLRDYLSYSVDRTQAMATLLVLEKIVIQKDRRSEVIEICYKCLSIPLRQPLPAIKKRAGSYLEDVFKNRDILERANVFRRHRSKIASKVSKKFSLNTSDFANIYSSSIKSSYFSARLDGMSSGQAALISQFCRISSALSSIAKRRSNILLLIDEGDSFLHLEWQRIYIYQLNKFLAMQKEKLRLESLQVIMSTHSPLLATDVPKQFICRLDSGVPSSTPIAFAATLHTLLNQSFQSKTIGEFASTRINELVDNLRAGVKGRRDKVISDSIDNPVIQAEIERLASLGSRL